VNAALLLLVVCTTTYAARVAFDLGGHLLSVSTDNWLDDAIIGASSLLCLWRATIWEDRRAWAAIGIALGIYFLGETYWNGFLANVANPPYPSWADAGYLGYYPPLYVGVMLLIRSRAPHFTVSAWLDGLLGALALASVAASVLFDPLVASTHGSAAKVATNLAYPTFDLLLLALVAGGFVLMGRRAGKTWLLLGLGLLIAGVGDSVYLYQVARGTYLEGSWITATWPTSTAIIALAAWTRNPRIARSSQRDDHSWTPHLLSGLFALMTLGVLVVDALQGIPAVAHVLVILAIIVLFARLFLAGRDRTLLAQSIVEARTDELTGLPNRRRLYEATDQALTASHQLALLLLDLDRFKELNDTLGHNAGDELLRQVAARLGSALPAHGLLARIGGDEFVVLLGDAPEESTALSTAHAMQRALEDPFQLEGLLIPVRASIGIALASDHAQTRSELLRCADVAMYRAKSQQSGIESYMAEGDGHTRGQLQLVSELRQAIADGQLVLHYQPKLSVGAGRFAGVEALVRWQHPRLGLLAPAEFLPLAEREGLMRSLTLEVLDQALAQQRAWRLSGNVVPVAVNIAPASLLDTRLPDEINALMQRYDTRPDQLELEITEDTLMRDPERALQVIARISELGIGFSLDDFGTGYSSLAQLRRLPVNTLKIDRSFIMNMSDNEEDANIVRSTIELGHSLNLSVVAEGVEDPADLRKLEQYGCDVVQGFHLGRPIPPEQVPGWLSRHRPAEDQAMSQNRAVG
jgi:diguanylate cyclase (GGDEF)-like protein